MSTDVLIAVVAILGCILFASARAQQNPGDVFQDCDTCPEMIVLPTGEAMLGSEPWVQGRLPFEGPVRTATIEHVLAMSQHETTRAQFKEFIDATGYVPVDNSQCFSWNFTSYLGYVSWHTWENPGFYQQETHPVVCVSWRDATAFAAWLTEKTGRTYRLPSSTEFEYASRAGTRGPWFWGTASASACTYANVADFTFRKVYLFDAPFDCDDGFPNTAPVGNYKPNPWGLYDILGNVWEWTDDCSREDVDNPPLNGAPWLDGKDADCTQRVVRSGSWVTGTGAVRAPAQYFLGDSYHSQILGFRLVSVMVIGDD